MNDTPLYERLLGLKKPWLVEQANMDAPTLTIAVTVNGSPDV